MSETNVERRSEDQRLKRAIFPGVGSHCLLPPVDAIAATVVPASSPSASRRGFRITLRPYVLIMASTMDLSDKFYDLELPPVHTHWQSWGLEASSEVG